MTHPFVSIVLCTYNGESFLKKQLETLVLQSYENFEVIAVDDCSTDNSPLLLKQQCALDSRFVLYQNSTNKGLNRNFEFGIQQAKGDYILICDQDDLWHPEKLERLISKINGSLLYYHDSELISKNERPLNKRLSDKYRLGSELNPLSFVALNCITGHTCMFSRELLSKPVFPFPEHVLYDNWLGFIASTYGKITYVDECLVRYRIHERNYAANQKKSKKLNDDTLRYCFSELNAFYDFTPDESKYKRILFMLRETYRLNRIWDKLNRVYLLLSQLQSFTAAREKNIFHRIALCIKMAYKPLPNHFAG